MNRASYYLVALLICADLGKEVYVGDWWRTLAFVAVVAMYAGLRDELTKTNP